ncbi:DNA/RNA non-specific endonuclease [Acidovorax sp. SUPP2539]|nr:DNA/RNA non-specific endonuclease [Acidovorax sp. SUPP2539]
MQLIEVILKFCWSHRVRFSCALVLSFAGAFSSVSFARTPQFDSTALLTPQPTSFAQCPQFFAGGKPPAIKPRRELRELCYEAFAVLHSGATRTPVYVAQRLNRQSIEDADEKRAKRFFADARLTRGERAELEDYKNSGYSRGHMAPAGNMPTPTAMAQSFSLANMVPQNSQHNGGPWNKIEQDTRRYVLRAKGDVFVVTGPVFTDSGPTIGTSGVKVPTYLYKLVYDATTHRAWAHWQENRAGETVGPPISYKELVKRTGVEFLPKMAVQH